MPSAGVDPSRREHRVRVEARPLADDHDLGARLVGGDRGPQARPAGADHENVRRVGAHVRHTTICPAGAASRKEADPRGIAPAGMRG